MAKLVTTEAMLRDIVTYENTYLGSTKRSLVIVTGKALVGIDLAQQPDVSIDQSARHISIGLPHAQLVGLETVLFEAPRRAQQAWLVNRFGANVNLGNINPAEALAVECLRLGLRSDTIARRGDA